MTTGIESPVTYKRVRALFEGPGIPKDLQMYFDTGNMGRKNEGINQVLRAFGSELVCGVHLKPKKGIHFVQNDGTDLKKVAE